MIVWRKVRARLPSNYSYFIQLIWKCCYGAPDSPARAVSGSSEEIKYIIKWPQTTIVGKYFKHLFFLGTKRKNSVSIWKVFNIIGNFSLREFDVLISIRNAVTSQSSPPGLSDKNVMSYDWPASHHVTVTCDVIIRNISWWLEVYSNSKFYSFDTAKTTIFLLWLNI